MTSTQFNLALMYFFFTYGLCEPLSNIALRRLGPKMWFPFIITAWGLVTTLTSQVSSYGGYIVIRLFLGVTEVEYRCMRVLGKSPADLPTLALSRLAFTLDRTLFYRCGIRPPNLRQEWQYSTAQTQQQEPLVAWSHMVWAILTVLTAGGRGSGSS